MEYKPTFRVLEEYQGANDRPAGHIYTNKDYQRCFEVLGRNLKCSGLDNGSASL
jgi:hypothetical protein